MDQPRGYVDEVVDADTFVVDITSISRRNEYMLGAVERVRLGSGNAPELDHGVHLAPFSLAPPNPTANAPSRRRPSARRGCPPPRTSRCLPMARHGRAPGSSRRDSQHALARSSTR